MNKTTLDIKRCDKNSNTDDIYVFDLRINGRTGLKSLKEAESLPCRYCNNPVVIIEYLDGATTRNGHFYRGVYCANCDMYYRNHREQLYTHSLADLDKHTTLLCEYCNGTMVVGRYNRESDYGDTEFYVDLICQKCGVGPPHYRYGINYDDLSNEDLDTLNERGE